MLETKDAGPSVYPYKDAQPTTQHKSLCSGKLGNVYYHFNVECVKRKNDYFVPFLCQLQSGIANRLLPVHKSVLMSAGIHH